SETAPTVLFEMTTHNLATKEGVDGNDFLDRVDTLISLGHNVLISNFLLFYQLKSFLRMHTSENIFLVVGASHLEKLFDPNFYKSLPGGLMEGCSRLFDDKTQVLVFPFKTSDTCMTTKTFHPQAQYVHLYQHLVSNNLVADISGCDQLDTS